MVHSYTSEISWLGAVVCLWSLHTSPDANISTRDLKPASPTSSLRIFSRDTFSFVPACETGVETRIISNLILRGLPDNCWGCGEVGMGEGKGPWL
jgi:hypothetical protein